MAGLPPAAIYVVLALFAAVENVLPPIPADTAVALGAFLSHRGLTTPLLVFAATWGANVAGAAGVYFAARRFGPRLFGTATGRRLLAPSAIAVIEREYLRFGGIGIFISRFLPGIRAVVPSFAGLVGIPPARALVPIAIASGIWYGIVILAGTLIGAEWERISSIIGRMNRGLAIAGVVALAVFLVLRRRRRRAEERNRVWRAVWEALDPRHPGAGEGERRQPESSQQRVALLVLELAYADEALTPEERATVEDHLRTRWGLEPPEQRPAAPPEAERRNRFAAYASRVASRVGRAERVALVERMWSVALSAGSLGAAEDRLTTLAAELLDLEPEEVAAARRTSGGAAR